MRDVAAFAGVGMGAALGGVHGSPELLDAVAPLGKDLAEAGGGWMTPDEHRASLHRPV